MTIIIDITAAEYELLKWAIRNIDNAYSLELRKNVLKIHTFFASWRIALAELCTLLSYEFMAGEPTQKQLQLAKYITVIIGDALDDHGYALTDTGYAFEVTAYTEIIPF